MSTAIDAFVTVELAADVPDASARMARRFEGCDLAHVAVFASPSVDLASVMKDFSPRAGCPVSACTTAGELGSDGYVENRILALGFPAARFVTRSIFIENLGDIDSEALARRVAAERVALAGEAAGRENGFALLLVDGLSLREDMLVAALAPGLGKMPLVGGSAGDGERFERTFVALDGACRQDAAVLTLVKTDLEVAAFSIDDVQPTETRMVVTAADPRRRVVREINGRPAALELARIANLPPGPIEEFAFAAYPTVVRIGSRTHVRAINRVTPEGHLVFFSAIDEGLVLTLARSGDLVRHLDASLTEITRGGAAVGVLACDCILRRIEARRGQRSRAVSELLSRHRVRGFSTYGEQTGGMHLNATLTGVALFTSAAP